MFLRAFLPPLIPGLLITGCTAPASYPSLLPRVTESRSWEEPVIAAPAPDVADPALDAKIADAMKILEERAAAFDAAGARGERLVASARGTAAGSEAWLNAQVALAELDALRSSTSEIALTLDDLASERALSLAPEYQPLTTAADRVRAAMKRQAERIATLQARLAPA
ncbi:hypothetical protein SPMU_14200 [Sphingomonas mucosissima]|uniref:Uncharacterized protein n=2 Tax=Sphingomonas mucosissima TaxID=370959 RepID=A0A245ZTK0_9SPHN|nr:hypothetical protein SPMU_14200 [Sphingomonas mucosissima]